MLLDKSYSLYHYITYILYILFKHHPGPTKTSNDHAYPKYDQSYPNFSLNPNTHCCSLKHQQQLKMWHFPEIKLQKKIRPTREGNSDCFSQNYEQGRATSAVFISRCTQMQLKAVVQFYKRWFLKIKHEMLLIRTFGSFKIRQNSIHLTLCFPCF